MMNRAFLPLVAAIAICATASSALAQIMLPVIFPLGRSQPAPPSPQQPGAPIMLGSPAELQYDLFAKAGRDTVYFPATGAGIDANAAATLTAQARWLLANPFVSIRLEGHGGADDSRDYALAIGDKRANAVRDFLMLQGIDPSRISVLSWGKERPGTVTIGTSVVAAGPRVVTVVVPGAPSIPPPIPPAQ
jgi:peptidoglycan-associated lipoprotein